MIATDIDMWNHSIYIGIQGLKDMIATCIDMWMQRAQLTCFH